MHAGENPRDGRGRVVRIAKGGIEVHQIFGIHLIRRVTCANSRIVEDPVRIVREEDILQRRNVEIRDTIAQPADRIRSGLDHRREGPETSDGLRSHVYGGERLSLRPLAAIYVRLPRTRKAVEPNTPIERIVRHDTRWEDSGQSETQVSKVMYSRIGNAPVPNGAFHMTKRPRSQL
jgi:hypothetical protein